MFGKISQEEQLEKMRREWDERARENARYYVATGCLDWTDEEFFASGEQAVREDILTDMENICQGKDPKQMRVIEVGSGAGRVTRALSNVFGEVHGVDVSGEMVERAQAALADRPGVKIFHNNGRDLSVLPYPEYDFAYSSIVFQHIPSREIVENYVREVNRLLRPGGLFKFQVQGDTTVKGRADDTWLGVSYSEAEAREMAERTNFEFRYNYGAGNQYFWLWFFKNRA